MTETNILITGPYRSGTTAVYNLTRCVCQFHGPTYGAFEDSYDERNPARFHVVKAHKYKPELVEWADVIITVFREPSEMWASMQRFEPANGRKLEQEDVWRSLSWLVHYQQFTDYFINFEQIERCPEKLAHNIAERIGIKVRPRIVVEDFLKIVPPKSGYDPVTLLHAKHRTKNNNYDHY